MLAGGVPAGELLLPAERTECTVGDLEPAAGLLQRHPLDLIQVVGDVRGGQRAPRD
ncbi:hypothetical protein HPP92_025778 [Vanilla planifolia]|uniref:Uncharacterized protein n=1 Tax=Vanilla planifolia TaxID=51239 RepID=A0A835U828_VANPL|nr:hypothetical protein HPP92_025778 [Vanilla planifolia]